MTDNYDVLVEWLRDQVMQREPRALRSALDAPLCLRYLSGEATRLWYTSVLNPSVKSQRSWCRLQPPLIDPKSHAWAFLSDCLETYTWLPPTNELIEEALHNIVCLTMGDGATALIWRPKEGGACELKALSQLTDEEVIAISPERTLRRVKLPTDCDIALFWDRETGALMLSYNDRAILLTSASMDTLHALNADELPLYYTIPVASLLNRLISM